MSPIRIESDTDEHWDARAARVAYEAMRRSAARGDVGIAQSTATWIAASLLFAAALVLMLASVRTPGDGTAADLRIADLRIAVTPADDVGRAIALPDQPPPIVALMADRRLDTGR